MNSAEISARVIELGRTLDALHAIGPASPSAVGHIIAAREHLLQAIRETIPAKTIISTFS